MKLSIIVPMYNVEQYVETCLESLLAQTFKDFEILVVNDGSTDSSPRIVEKLALHNSCIKLLHKQNGGLSDARNYALDYALGEYIAFLDSDDYVEPTLYEKLVKKMDEGLDIVVTDIEYIYEDKTPSWILPGLSGWSVEDIQKRALLSPMFAWNKLYRRSFFKEQNMRYPLNTWYEDIPVTTYLFAKTNRIGYVNETLIHYRQRRGSIMSERNSERVKEIFSVLEIVRDKFKQENLDERYRAELEYLHIEHLCLYGMFRFINSDNFEELYKQSMLIMKEHFPKWKKNPYIKNLGIKNRLFLRSLNRFTKDFWQFVIQN